MPRHAKEVGRHIRTIRMSTVALVWLCGLAAGFSALLVAVARYACTPHNQAMACHTSGSVLGIVLIVAVIAVVTAVTVITFDRPPRWVLATGGVGLAALVVCLVFTWELLASS